MYYNKNSRFHISLNLKKEEWIVTISASLEYDNALLYLKIFYKNVWIDINYVWFLFSCNEELIFLLFLLKSMYLRKISQKIQLILSQENKEYCIVDCSNVTYTYDSGNRYEGAFPNATCSFTTKTVSTAFL